MVGFVNATQKQFPRVSVHLLVGFGDVHIVHRADRSDATNEGWPKRAVQQYAQQALASGAQTVPEGNVVLLTPLFRWPGRGHIGPAKARARICSTSP